MVHLNLLFDQQSVVKVVVVQEELETTNQDHRMLYWRKEEHDRTVHWRHSDNQMEVENLNREKANVALISPWKMRRFHVLNPDDEGGRRGVGK